MCVLASPAGCRSMWGQTQGPSTSLGMTDWGGVRWGLARAFTTQEAGAPSFSRSLREGELLADIAAPGQRMVGQQRGAAMDSQKQLSPSAQCIPSRSS